MDFRRFVDEVPIGVFLVVAVLLFLLLVRRVVVLVAAGQAHADTRVLVLAVCVFVTGMVVDSDSSFESDGDVSVALCISRG